MSTHVPIIDACPLRAAGLLRRLQALVWLFGLLLLAGCQNNPLMGGPNAAWQATAQPQTYQLRDL